MATIGTIAGIAATGVGIASAAGAFSPSAVQSNSGDSSSAPPAVTQEISNLQGTVNSEQATISQLSATVSSQKNMEYLAIGLGVASVVLALMHRNKNK